MNYIDKKGTILIIATMVVVMLSAISATLMMQIQADTNYTQFARNRMTTETLLKGSIHESLKILNFNVPHVGHIGLHETTPWTPANDVGMDGVPNTRDLGEGDKFPTFPIPGVYGPGEPGAVGQSVHIGVQVRPTTGGTKIYGVNVDDESDQRFEAYYAVYDENLGSNGIDDNGDGKTDSGLPDNDSFEAAFHRLWAVAYYGGEFRKMVVMVAASNATNPSQTISETFFKAIYAGNSSEDPNYFLDMGGNGKNGDAVAGDVYITGNLRLANASFMWKQEKYVDENGNNMFDFGEPFSDGSGQEAGFYNFGTEATISTNIRSNIGKDWQTKQPTIGGSGPYGDGNGAPAIDPPDFNTSLAAVTIDVGAEITASSTAVTIPAFGAIPAISGRAINDVSNPAHMFIKANASELADLQGAYHAGYVNNGLPTYILGDIALRQANPPVTHGVTVPESGNNQVYYIDGNLCVGAGPIRSIYFKPPDNTDHSIPIRITFLVQGNVIVNDDVTYRHGPTNNTGTAYPNDKNYTIAPSTSFPQFGTAAWNPYEDAFALIALKNENAPTNSGNIQFSDLVTTNLANVDAIMYAENNFESRYGFIDPSITINGMMLAGNHLRLNQEYVNGQWRARPDDQRNRYTINFDTRIRELLSDPSWLPGLPGGTNRSGPPPTPDEDSFTFDVILSSTNS